MGTRHSSLSRRVVVTVCASAALLTAAVAASATRAGDAASLQIAFATQVTFGEPPIGTFQATAPLCVSGTTTDAVVRRTATETVVDRTFTCADGSGHFTLRLRVLNADLSATWRARAGDGLFANIRGHGRGQGAVTSDGENDVNFGSVNL